MSENLLEMTAEIVSAYVSNNPVPPLGISKLIADVSVALANLSDPMPVLEQKPTPAVNPKRSVHDEYIVCLEDGKKFKSLKRHLMASYGMTPEQYRERWGLPADYPMVAPSYSAERSSLAKERGLGKRREPEPVAVKPARKLRRTATTTENS